MNEANISMRAEMTPADFTPGRKFRRRDGRIVTLGEPTEHGDFFVEGWYYSPKWIRAGDCRVLPWTENDADLIEALPPTFVEREKHRRFIFTSDGHTTETYDRAHVEHLAKLAICDGLSYSVRVLTDNQEEGTH